MFFSISLWGYYRVWRMERARLSPRWSRLTSLVLTLTFGCGGYITAGHLLHIARFIDMDAAMFPSVGAGGDIGYGTRRPLARGFGPTQTRAHGRQSRWG